MWNIVQEAKCAEPNLKTSNQDSKRIVSLFEITLFKEVCEVCKISSDLKLLFWTSFHGFLIVPLRSLVLTGSLLLENNRD